MPWEYRPTQVCCSFLQTHGAEALPCPCERPRLPEPVEPAEEDQVLEPRDTQVERAIPRRDESEQLPVAAVSKLFGWDPSKPDRALARLDEACERPEECGFARSIGPQERVDLPLAHLERHAIQRARRAEVTHDILGLHRDRTILRGIHTGSSDEDVRHSRSMQVNRLQPQHLSEPRWQEVGCLRLVTSLSRWQARR